MTQSAATKLLFLQRNMSLVSRLLNTLFQKKCVKLLTHIYTNGVKAQLDYMLVNLKLINGVMNTEAYNYFEGVSSNMFQ